MEEFVSVVVPIYNSEKSLEKCIESICNQTYKQLDIILIDDGSTDKSGKICDEYENMDSRIRTIHKQNAGVSAARNTGIENAVGKYLVFVDSDDFLEAEFVELLLTTKRSYEDAFVICGFKLYEMFSKRPEIYRGNPVEELSVFAKEHILLLISKWMINMPWNKLYVLDELKKNQVYMNEELQLAEDLLFNLDYIDKTSSQNIVVINKPLYNYCMQDSGTLGTKYCPNQLEIMRLINSKLFNFCEKWCPNKMELCNAQALQYLENVFVNTMKKDNPHNILQKIKYNNTIMKSKEYQRYLQKSEKTFSFGRRVVCKSGSYLLFALLCKFMYVWNPIKEILYQRIKKPIIELWRHNGR